MPEVTTYVGNLVMKDSHPELLKFDGGYASFDHDTIAGLHLYIRDYMGNNRVVANQDGTIEQITHYYPYGGVIGDISTNETLQKNKFEGKELDRTFGLDNYDVEARQYFAMAPMWDRVDPLAEKYYGISPYVYCGGDPVNQVDKNGENPILIGAAIGGCISAASALLSGADWKHVATAAIGGAIDGAVTACGPQNIVLGALGGSIGKTVENLLNDFVLGDEDINYTADAISSGIMGGMSGAVVAVTKPVRTNMTQTTTPQTTFQIKESYQTKEMIIDYKKKAEQKLGPNATKKEIKKEGQNTRKRDAKQEIKESHSQATYEGVIGGVSSSSFHYIFDQINKPFQ